MPLALCIVAILLLILLVVYFKLDTFISFLLVSIGLGIATGMNIHAISASIQNGDWQNTRAARSDSGIWSDAG